MSELNQKRVEAEIAEIATMYANGLCTKMQALEKAIDIVDSACRLYLEEHSKFLVGDAETQTVTDYDTAQSRLSGLRRVERFKRKISFGELVK